MKDPENTSGDGTSQTAEPQPLRIEGIAEAPLTPEPDKAELAAMAVLALLAGGKGAATAKPAMDEPKEGTVEYYEALAGKIRRAHEAERMSAARATAYCEQELERGRLPESGDGSPAFLSSTLYRHIDTVEREGGELKLRWQHCLAEVTVMELRIKN